MDKPVILLFHGLASSPKELSYISHGLRTGGFEVFIPELRGYTHTLLNGSKYDMWANLALDEYDKLRSKYTNVIVGGLCIGALLALYVAQNRKVHKVLALSTTLYYDGWGKSLDQVIITTTSVYTIRRQNIH